MNFPALLTVIIGSKERKTEDIPISSSVPRIALGTQDECHRPHAGDPSPGTWSTLQEPHADFRHPGRARALELLSTSKAKISGAQGASPTTKQPLVSSHSLPPQLSPQALTKTRACTPYGSAFA